MYTKKSINKSKFRNKIIVIEVRIILNVLKNISLNIEKLIKTTIPN